MATVLITYGIPAEGFAALEGHKIIIPPAITGFTEEELLTHIAEADAVVAASRLPGNVIRAARHLKIIATYGAGYDSVDIAAAAECGIPVTNIPECVTRDTAELAIALMLSVCRRMGELNLRLRKGPSEPLFGIGRNMGNTLRGLTLGIVGCGRIGGRVAEVAKALGMNVVGYSRRGADPAVAHPVSLDELLEISDVVSLHCPLTPETRGLIGKDAFDRMKDGAVLINTSRGAVVDTSALVEALSSGKLAGAGLDVFPDEPRVPAELLAMDNVVCTPHIGSNTHLARREMAEALSRQILDALSGKRPVNIVNGL